MTITIACTPEILYDPLAATPVPNILNPQEQYVHDSNVAQFTYPDFYTNMNTACPVLNVELSTDNLSVVPPAGLTYTYSLYDTTNEIITVDDSTKKGVYKFYFKITAKGPITRFTEMYTLNVVCNSASTTISYDTTIDHIQYVDTSTLTM